MVIIVDASFDIVVRELAECVLVVVRVVKIIEVLTSLLPWNEETFGEPSGRGNDDNGVTEVVDGARGEADCVSCLVGNRTSFGDDT